MVISCYFREDSVYVPTVARRASGPIYTDIEPIAVIPIIDLDAVRQALRESLKRGNAIIPDRDPKDREAPPAILKYARVRSWSAFFRSAWTWSIRDDDGLIKIIGYRRHPKGYWEQDPAQEIRFPRGTTVDDVIDRMITILQAAARRDADV
jgi:hypothetical protein